METIEKVTLINGNGREIKKALPRIVLHSKFNDVAMAHIEENTGLHFESASWGRMTAQPHSSNQIVALLMTYNFKTRYYDNATFGNELHLKSDHHIGFEVDSICGECVKENNIKMSKFIGRVAC